ncbi:MAG: aldehyde dehydrogenase family protein [Planctomycetota bacterium]
MQKQTQRLLASIDPATGEVVGEVPVTTVAEIASVVARARAACGRWRGETARARAELLRPAGQRLIERADELGRLITREMGKPLKEAIGEVRGCGAGLAKAVDEMAAALAPEEIANGDVVSTIYYDPFGVCAAITPWNFPIAMPQWMVLPALIAGNTVILKPSEETPLIADAYAAVLNECLPRDVLQVVHGDEEQGKALVNAAVDLIAFTGSRAAGKHILAAAASGLKRVILELGGKDPLIVLDDADLDAAARFAANNSFRNAGQVCVSTERIYVDAKIANAFEGKLAGFTQQMRVGSGLDSGVQVGPVVNARQRDHVLGLIDDATRRGARVVTGNRGHHDNFVMPTVLADLPDDAAILHEETFGPVTCLQKFVDVGDAITRANRTPYGLGAVVFGADAARATAVARRLDAGMIGINKSCGGAEGTPWVGAKESGYGFHGSPSGHRQFAQVRVLTRSR